MMAENGMMENDVSGIVKSLWQMKLACDIKVRELDTESFKELKVNDLSNIVKCWIGWGLAKSILSTNMWNSQIRYEKVNLDIISTIKTQN